MALPSYTVLRVRLKISEKMGKKMGASKLLNMWGFSKVIMYFSVYAFR